jgi:hypothetical protein
VFKALRGEVQDVAVKQLLHTADGQLESFMEVTPCHTAACICVPLQGCWHLDATSKPLAHPCPKRGLAVLERLLQCFLR